MAYFLRFTGIPFVMLSLAATSVVIVSVVYYKRPKRKIVVTNGQLHEEPIISSRKIFTLTGETVAQD